MADLADQVIQANKQEQNSNIDELGIGIADTMDYVVARILYINTLERKKDPRAPMLHTRKNRTELWKGNLHLECGKDTIYELSHIYRRLKDYEIAEIWATLLRFVPELDDSRIIISDGLYWDTETCELVRTNEDLLWI